MNYPDSVRFLYALGNELKTAKLGLDRIARLMTELGDPQKKPRRFVHVAGTNGKGSTCAMIERGLRAAGFATGLYTSPHLHEPTERIRINGDPIRPTEFTQAFDKVHRAAEMLIEQGEIDSHPSYFESVTAMAWILFRDHDVDVAVLEVGLGGRLDATNVVEPELCVITPIDFDHEKYLGSSIESIAAEKAGILKANVPVVLSHQRPEAERVVRERAHEVSARVIPALRATHVAVFRDRSEIEAGGMRLECRLAGRHQVTNALTAGAALATLGVPAKAIQTGIEGAYWPGRLDRVQAEPEVVVDGAHNPAGAKALAEYVREFYADAAPVLIFGAMRDKAVSEMAAILFPHFREVVLTAPRQERALSPRALADVMDHPRIRIAPDLEAAVHSVASRKAPLFISGSLFLAAEALELFKRARHA